jgi:EmrB/QacA subfamily drug resistance transporter
MALRTANLANAEPSDAPWVLWGAILASSMAFIDSTALNVALPALQTDLHTSGAELLWIVNAYLLMLSSMILVGGSLGDRLGRKRVFMTGIALFMLSSLSCGLAPNSLWLIGSRLVQGVGGALMVPGSLALIATAFDADRRGRAIGTWSSVTTLVTIAGPVLGGTLADAGLWRGVFLINLPLGSLALFILATRVRESRDEAISGSIDYPGAALAVVGLGGLTYGFISAPGLGYADPRVFGSLAVGGCALAAFAWVEARSSNPMMPFRLFRSPTFGGANLLTLFLYGALGAGLFFLSLDLIQIQGYSQALAGLAFTPFAILLTLMSRWAGGLVDRYGPRLPLIVGPALAGVGFLLMGLTGLTRGPADYWRTFFPGVIGLGLGMGVTVAPLTTAVMGSAATHYAGTASGINNAVARCAGLLTVAILGAVALFAFSGGLETGAARLNLPDAARQALHAEAGQLGAAQVPPAVGVELKPAVASVIRSAFADACREVLMVCAALAWLSAAMSALLIEPRLRPPPA